MTSQPDALAAGIVRESISYNRLPWTRPLVEAATHRHATVARFFPGDPADPAAWQAAIDRVARQPRRRDAVAELVQAQLQRRSAPDAAQAAARDLGHASTVAVVTGQQAGLFGGPLYTLLKAVTAIQLARRTQARHGTRTVAVFWVDAEDHDWNEVRSIEVLDRDAAPVTITAADPPGAGSHPVGGLTFDARIDETIAELGERLPPTEFTAPLLDALRRHYRAGTSPAAACAGWLDQLLGAEGLVVVDASDPAARRLAGSVFVQEFSHPCATARLAREAGEHMARAGHAPQVVPSDDVVCAFKVEDRGRLAIRCREGRFLVGDREVAADQLIADAEAHPDHYSPNVLLRPIVQDTLFPTICYVGGPSELAYHAQLGEVYAAFGLARPLVVPRASATLIDGAAARFLERHDMPLEALQSQDESALNQLLARQMPAEIEATFGDIERALADIAPRLASAAAAVDPTLGGAADTTVVRMRETVKNLHAKILQAAKKKDDTLRRQFLRTRALAFPGGAPQERALGTAYFVNRYGPSLGPRLIESLPMTADSHYLVVP